MLEQIIASNVSPQDQDISGGGGVESMPPEESARCEHGLRSAQPAPEPGQSAANMRGAWVADLVEDGVTSSARALERQPVGSLLIAAAVGYLIAYLAHRRI